MTDVKPVNGSQIEQYSPVGLPLLRPPLYHFQEMSLSESASAMLGRVCGGSVKRFAPSGLTWPVAV